MSNLHKYALIKKQEHLRQEAGARWQQIVGVSFLTVFIHNKRDFFIAYKILQFLLSRHKRNGFRYSKALMNAL